MFQAMMGFDDEVGPLGMSTLQSPYSCSASSLWALIHGPGQFGFLCSAKKNLGSEKFTNCT
jgi:hypothetical protein